MDEPLIPELPTVPSFPGDPGSTEDQHRYPSNGSFTGYADNLGPDPLGSPYDDPLAEPTDARPAATPSPPFPGPANEQTAPPSQARHESDTDRDQPVLPFAETTGFFQRSDDTLQGAAAQDPAIPHGQAGPPDTAYRSPTAVAHENAPVEHQPRPDERHRLFVSAGGRRSRPSRTGGLPGWAAITISLACTGAAILADLTLTRSVGVLFGLCFVLTAVGIAAGVRRSAMFTAGVLPPLAALAAFVVMGTAAPERFVSEEGGSLLRIGSAILSGLASSAWFLVAAWAVALGTIALRSARLPSSPGRGRSSA